MFIAIDIGNTHTVIGLYKKDILLAFCRLTRRQQRTKDDIFGNIHSMLIEFGAAKKNINGIGISSVVPDLTDVYTAMTKKYFHQEAMIVSTHLNLGIKILYDNPQSLGADRICNAIAGYAKYGGPLIIIDFGTATTYDVVALNGDFLGGVIAPGIGTSAISLHRNTAKLPKIIDEKFIFPEYVINTTTVSSMQAGIFWGALDAMTAMVRRIQKELYKHHSKKAVVIATGGFSKLIAEHTRVIQHVEPTLVLDGIMLISQRKKIIANSHFLCFTDTRFLLYGISSFLLIHLFHFNRKS
jgi:type III pantothenate kinase